MEDAWQALQGLTTLTSYHASAGSDPDNIDTSDNSYYYTGWVVYKPKDGDSDPNHNYRVIRETGSGHGGDFDHYLYYLKQRNDMSSNSSQYWVDNSPNCSAGTGAPTTVTWSVGISDFFTAGIAKSYTTYPDTYGLQRINATQFDQGWNGPGKKCDRDNGDCEYVGTGGVGEWAVSAGSGWKLIAKQELCWHNIFNSQHCKWMTAE